MERSSPERPLSAYGALMAAYSFAFVGPLAIAARRGVLPERPGFADLALVGVGLFKLSRLLTTDAVTGFIRAPFVRYEEMESVTTQRESVGWPTMLTAAWNALAPGAVDRYLAANSYDAQQEDGEELQPEQPDNLFEPVPLAVGAAGRFGDEAHTRAVRVPAALARGALVVSAVAAAAGLTALGRVSKNGK